MTAILSCLTLSACQKPDNQQKNPSKQNSAATENTSDHTEIPAFPQDCNSVDTAIQTLKKSYSPEDLDALNQLFKKCLPDVPLETRYQWQEQSTEIYQKLLEQSSPIIYQYITNMTGDLEPISAQQKKELYKKLKPKEKYLVDHAKSLYLEKFYVGEGEYTIVHHPQYDVDIFAPYLEKSDQIYFKQLRKEYTGQNYIMDAGLAISFDEVANRLLFWENFNKTYPNNHYKSDVHDFIKSYRTSLFQGDDNTRVIWYNDTEFTDKEAIQAITKVSKANSSSSAMAKEFLALVKVKEKEWEQLPKPTYGNDGDGSYESPAQVKIREQRNQFSTETDKAIESMIENTDL